MKKRIARSPILMDRISVAGTSWSTKLARRRSAVVVVAGGDSVVAVVAAAETGVAGAVAGAAEIGVTAATAAIAGSSSPLFDWGSA